MSQRRTSKPDGPPRRWQRLFALAGDHGESLATVQVRWFRRYLLLYGATRSWLLSSDGDFASRLVYLPSALLLTVALGLTVRARTEVWAPRVGLVALLGLAWATFPTTPNHFYLELLAMAALATVGRQNECDAEHDAGSDAADALSALRWLTAIVLFHTGLQKVLYGCYFDGAVFAYLTAQDPRFAWFFGFVLPADEIARLASYDPLRTGSGPYTVDSPVALLLSNLVWSAELVLPALMIAPRTRTAAALAATAFVVGFQLAAREAGFAALFGGLALLFVPRAPLRYVVPVAAVVCTWAVAAAFGVVPGGDLVRSVNP